MPVPSRAKRSSPWRTGVALSCAAALWAASAPAAVRGLPPIVFVSREPASGRFAAQVPGLGPHGTFATGAGALMERDTSGRVRALLPAGRMLDVADPAVSDDGTRVAFAGIEKPGGRWRIWVLARASGALACATCGEPGLDPPADDADPCWWGDSLVFASTRAGGRALYDGTPVTELWLCTAAVSGRLRRLTHEAGGALDPCVDPRGGRRLVYARWWFNPWTSARAGGLTRERALASSPDSVNTWQVVSAALVRDDRGAPALAGLRLAAGGTAARRRGMGVQPALGPGGRVVATAARNMGLAPSPGTLTVQAFGAPPSAGARLAGAAIGDDAGDPYTENANLRAPAACAPAVLPDGRVLVSLDPGGHGDFALWLVSADGERRERVLDYPRTLELDAATVPVRPVSARRAPSPPGRDRTPARAAEPVFTYLDTDVFAGRGAPARRAGARLRVFRRAGPDSVEQLHDVAVPRSGRIDLTLPADTPLFEQLTDARGVVLMSAHGPAQVRGFNSGAAGLTARCTGCHLGHSTIVTR